MAIRLRFSEYPVASYKIANVKRKKIKNTTIASVMELPLMMTNLWLVGDVGVLQKYRF